MKIINFLSKLRRRHKLFIVLVLIGILLTLKNFFFSPDLIVPTNANKAKINGLFSDFGKYAFESYQVDSVANYVKGSTFFRLKDKIQNFDINDPQHLFHNKFQLDSVVYDGKDHWIVYFRVFLSYDIFKNNSEIDQEIEEKMNFSQEFRKKIAEYNQKNKEVHLSDTEYFIGDTMVSSFSTVIFQDKKFTNKYGYLFILN